MDPMSAGDGSAPTVRIQESGTRIDIEPRTGSSADLPYRPRALQADLHRRLKRFNVLVAHRRFGKDVLYH